MTSKFKIALATLTLAASGIVSSQTLLNGSYDVVIMNTSTNVEFLARCIWTA